MRTPVLLVLAVVGAIMLNSAKGAPGTGLVGEEAPLQENKRTGLTGEDALLQEDKREDPMERRHSGRLDE